MPKYQQYSPESEQGDSRQDPNHPGNIDHSADNDIPICHYRSPVRIRKLASRFSIDTVDWHEQGFAVEADGS
jgi:hypothetical protein